VCPDDDALIALVEHALAPQELATIEGHVDGCARCRATIGHLAAIDDGAAPRRVGRYRLERPLGEGGMGVVWKAWDPMLERAVAIKLLHAGGGADATTRLVREARALAKLQHPNVVVVHDVGEHDGEVFVATELVDGQPMQRWQLERDPREILGAYAQAARGLAAAHALGLVHRDVKPANILVGRDGRVRVGDFGLVAPSGPIRGDEDTQVTAQGAIVGTPAYMAPEQRTGAGADERSDQFSLCLALAEALTGARPPPDARAAALAAGAVVAPWDAIARGLARDPRARWPDMTALAVALEASAPAPLPKRTLAIGGAIVAAAVAIAGGAWIFASRSGGAPKPPPSARELANAIVAVQDAGEDHDVDRCRARVADLAAMGDAGRAQAEQAGAICEMLAGHCDAAKAVYPDATAPYIEKTWCPIEGDLATRLDRAWTQAGAHEHLAYCRAIEPAVRAVVADASAQVAGKYDSDSNVMRMKAADAMNAIGRCYALAHQCADAARAWALETQARGVDVGHIECKP
jgi:hypothetical protein